MAISAPFDDPPGAQAVQRRAFLGALLAAASGLVAAALAVPLVRFAVYPLRAAKNGASWSEIGKISDFAALTGPVARTVRLEKTDGWRSSLVERSVYVIPLDGGKVKVLSSVCPHLGCTVGWMPKRNEFVCPCHGGTFTVTGTRVSGPPRRAMDELEARVENGAVMVRFQYFSQLLATKEPVA
jgi:menaquinol-cytochrome c reductase iron-sulfur subunit